MVFSAVGRTPPESEKDMYLPADTMTCAAFIAYFSESDTVGALAALWGSDIAEDAEDAWASRCAGAKALAEELEALKALPEERDAAFAAYYAEESTCGALDDIKARIRGGFTRSTETCGRCGGSGRLHCYAHVANGVCYGCGGSGRIAV